MNLTLVSHFRNAAHYIERYLDQVSELEHELDKRGDSLNLLLGYGDSRDKTGEMLHEGVQHRFVGRLVEVSHGGHHYGSVVHPQRFKQLALVGNRLWQNLPGFADCVALVESDLIWSGSTLASLLDGIKGARSHDTGINSPILLAPLVKHLDGRFYDTWAFRMAGERFTNRIPYHPALLTGANLYEMDSVGSCVFMEAALARELYWPEEDVFVGFCRLAREQGATIYLVKTLEVYHP